MSLLAEAPMEKWEEFGRRIAEKIIWPEESTHDATKVKVMYDPVFAASRISGRR
jgi:hypothetical protein